MELEHLGRQSEDTHNALEVRILDLEGQLDTTRQRHQDTAAEVAEAELKASHFEARAKALQSVPAHRARRCAGCRCCVPRGSAGRIPSKPGSPS